MERQAVELSLIIPALNEAASISATLATAAAALRNLGRSFEIIVVDDGSEDETGCLVRAAQSQLSGEILLLSHACRLGKGAAVKEGMLAARGGLRFFTDAGLPYPLDQLPAFLVALETSADVAIGKRTNVSPYQRLSRRLASFPFRVLVQMVTMLPYTDSQCGLKGFRAQAAQALFAGLGTQGYGFDVEILLLARQRGYQIAEIPLEWNDPGHSSLKMWKDPARMVWEVLTIWWRLAR